MNAKIKVTFDMSLDNTSGECKTQVSFELPDHPDTPCSDSLKQILIGEIKMLCGAMDAAGAQLFSANRQSPAMSASSQWCQRCGGWTDHSTLRCPDNVSSFAATTGSARCEALRAKPARYLSNRNPQEWSYQKCGRKAVTTSEFGKPLCAKCAAPNTP